MSGIALTVLWWIERRSVLHLGSLGGSPMAFGFRRALSACGLGSCGAMILAESRLTAVRAY